MTEMSRRMMLGGMSAAGLASAARAQIPDRPGLAPERLAQEEDYWRAIAGLYETPDGVTNLEGGYWGVMTRPVREAFFENVRKLNAGGSYYVRGAIGADMAAVRARVASVLDAEPEEILFVRSATEALQILIAGYNRLEPGDGALYADLDYGAMKIAMEHLRAARGADVIRIDLPEPGDRASILAAYEAALDANPHVRLLLVTHVNNLTGLIHPVAEINAMARARGVDVIVDAAHAVGQVPFDYEAAGCDFVGANLHKWIGAPLGCGVIRIRRSRIADIDNFLGEPGDPADINTKAHTGAINFALFLTIPAALDMHEAMGGAEAKFARLRRLRDLWVSEAREIDGVEILTPDEAGSVGAMTSFRLAGRTSATENDRIAQRLLEEHGVFTVRRSGPSRGDCIRVTPNFWNTPEDVERLVPALRALAG